MSGVSGVFSNLELFIVYLLATHTSLFTISIFSLDSFELSKASYFEELYII